ncbi:hypothetical protein CFE70_000188 [Pyrenophora teres f. teres 0-1]|uniref:Uncharacterized protein n=2 Tax=Pyrenophora teres f. teres TaxID=97479 RepID=E3RGK2_PYRTT|nr:hypothetical protein PTT_06937 [Pyrenophora teres f. teres 0-1]KAE8836557.1 hypothetical protein HRS9139_04655 [Pyrenophora teres f. teres]KAE8837471.1 hypothetical protein PTNB85_04806 [Pyrenophora teres f. teres]KAE8840107.1 hypothetical protein HRS9122_06712 [Pyrenophora teres f. teres]KAE8862297.1 hypothetical protein PTNB29_04859 [Pyrenophora teres f. teres]
MPIKPGDLVANSPGPKSTMVWDGRRMRVLWQKSHGDGDPNNNLIPQAKTTIRGHPTWKLYDGDVPGRIIRGKDEPPHYVYLDDRVCYATFSSKAYTTKELNTYWPFDFDRFGNILTMRPNRGRPAFTDDSCTAYATGPMRGTAMNKYEFCGASDLLREYNVVPPSKDRKQRPQAPESRLSDKISLSGTLPDLNKMLLTSDPTTPKAPPTIVMPKAMQKSAPLPKATLSGNIKSVFSPPPKRDSEMPSSDISIKCEDNDSTQYTPGPVESTLTPPSLPVKNIHSSPQFDSPSAPATFRKRPLPGSLANFYPKRIVNDTFPVEPRVARRGFFAESFAVDMPEAKRIKEEEEDSDT